MADDARARLKKWLASGQVKLYPLTFPQRELWETSPVPPSSPANHICSFFEVEGPVTLECFRGAVSRVVERQEAMRTSFLPARDRPLQIVSQEGQTVARYRELTAEECEPAALEAIMEQGFREPFDFLRGPLYRLELLRRGEEDFVIAFTIHHALGDGWTLGAFIEDLCTAYLLELQDSGELDLGEVSGAVEGLRTSLPALPQTYNAWGAAERARWTPDEIAKRATFWQERLAGTRPLFGEGDRSTPLAKWVTEIPPQLVTAVRSLARESGTTLFSTLLAAFQIALHRLLGVDDIVVGSPVADRTKPTVREVMGSFAGIVPLRGRVDTDQPFAEHLQTVHHDTMDAFEHALPFAELAALLGESSNRDRHAVFDTRFALQNHPIPDIALPGISTKLRVVSTGTARFDLGCEITEDEDAFELVWLYRTSVVPLERVRDLDGRYREVLETVCDVAEAS